LSTTSRQTPVDTGQHGSGRLRRRSPCPDGGHARTWIYLSDATCGRRSYWPLY